MNKLQDFNSFASARRQEVQIKLEQEQDAKRTSSAETFKSLLSEYGVTDLNELDEEQRKSFFDKLRGNEVNEDVNYMIDRLEEAYVAEEVAEEVEEEEDVEEGNAFGAARAKAIADGKKEFTVDGETYPVEDVDAEDKENAEDFAGESVEVNEADIKSDEDFKEYAFSVLQKAFGDDFDEAKAQEVVDGILSKAGGDYGQAAGMLQSSLG
jgi:preprotein translocase subunit SecD